MTDELCRVRTAFLGDHIHLTMNCAAVGAIGPCDREAHRRRLHPEGARPTGSAPAEAVDQRRSFLADQSLNHRQRAGGGTAAYSAIIAIYDEVNMGTKWTLGKSEMVLHGPPSDGSTLFIPKDLRQRERTCGTLPWWDGTVLAFNCRYSNGVQREIAAGDAGGTAGIRCRHCVRSGTRQSSDKRQS
jgi:hypothetical protein